MASPPLTPLLGLLRVESNLLPSQEQLTTVDVNAQSAPSEAAEVEWAFAKSSMYLCGRTKSTGEVRYRRARKTRFVLTFGSPTFALLWHRLHVLTNLQGSMQPSEDDGDDGKSKRELLVYSRMCEG